MLTPEDQAAIERANRRVIDRRRKGLLGPTGLVCARCGRRFGRRAAFNNHIRTCRGRGGDGLLEL